MQLLNSKVFKEDFQVYSMKRGIFSFCWIPMWYFGEESIMDEAGVTVEDQRELATRIHFPKLLQAAN